MCFFPKKLKHGWFRWPSSSPEAAYKTTSITRPNYHNPAIPIPLHVRLTVAIRNRKIPQPLFLLPEPRHLGQHVEQRPPPPQRHHCSPSLSHRTLNHHLLRDRRRPRNPALKPRLPALFLAKKAKVS